MKLFHKQYKSTCELGYYGIETTISVKHIKYCVLALSFTAYERNIFMATSGNKLWRYYFFWCLSTFFINKYWCFLKISLTLGIKSDVATDITNIGHNKYPDLGKLFKDHTKRCPAWDSNLQHTAQWKWQGQALTITPDVQS